MLIEVKGRPYFSVKYVSRTSINSFARVSYAHFKITEAAFTLIRALQSRQLYLGHWNCKDNKYCLLVPPVVSALVSGMRNIPSPAVRTICRHSALAEISQPVPRNHLNSIFTLSSTQELCSKIYHRPACQKAIAILPPYSSLPSPQSILQTLRRPQAIRHIHIFPGMEALPSCS